MKQKMLVILFMTFLSISLLFSSIAFVQGESPLGFGIIQVVEQGSTTSITQAEINIPVTVHALSYNTNEYYEIYFGDLLVDNGTSSGYYVSSNFSIPAVVAGTYNITFYSNQYYDFLTFTVPAQYTVHAVMPNSPNQLQTGSNIVLNVTISGAPANTLITANITIEQPSPASNEYSELVTLMTSESGIAITQIAFPDSSFTPLGSNTAYAGTYTAYFNKTENLGKSTFNLGITDKTEYSREETVIINTVGYQSGQTASLTIKNQEDTTLLSRTVTASNQGIIQSEWVIPSTAALGTYNITIIPQGTLKTVTDSQNFTISGHPITFYALNLAGETVSGIEIKAYDADNDLTYSQTTYLPGYAIINLEKGTYTITGYWNDIKVAEEQATFTGTSSYNLTCKLTNLQIKVIGYQENQQIAISNVNIDITIKYGAGYSKTTTATGQTDSSGVYLLQSTLPDAQYTILASKYNSIFNSGNNTLTELPNQAYYQAIILCPQNMLSLHTVDSNFLDISNVRIELVEQSNGVFYTITTDASGAGQLSVIFGQYRIKAYNSDNVLLTETTIDV
ncbi:MAG: hypothetical protein GX638_02815, partial [Crenarchaeota archaeon]|nr:hypothetical protein [Thermoproteota archaeon]